MSQNLNAFNRRVLFLDTETTGLTAGIDRLIEIGIVETIDGEFTHNNLEMRIKSPVPISYGAQKVHGISDHDLRNEKPFADRVPELLNYLSGAYEIIIHNALFDTSFLDYEFELLGLPPLAYQCRAIRCSLALARSLHATKNSLDNLADRYGIDRSGRVEHGSIIDAQLLKEVFYEMISRNGDHPKIAEYLSYNFYKIHHLELKDEPVAISRFDNDSKIVDEDIHLRGFNYYMSVLDDLKKDHDDRPFIYEDRSVSKDL